MDEWSGDRGCGAQYLSQQAVGRLLAPAGIEADPASSLPERLVRLQELMAAGDERAARVYETIGTYLGYALLGYRDVYDFDDALVLGRVVTGIGGDIVLARAQEVLASDDAVDPAAGREPAGDDHLPHGLGARQAARPGGRRRQPARPGVIGLERAPAITVMWTEYG